MVESQCHDPQWPVLASLYLKTSAVQTAAQRQWKENSAGLRSAAVKQHQCECNTRKKQEPKLYQLDIPKDAYTKQPETKSSTVAQKEHYLEMLSHTKG